MSVKKHFKKFYLMVSVLFMSGFFQSVIFAESEISASFHMESAYIKGEVTDAVLKDLERAVSQILSEQAALHFPFLNWQAAESNDTSGTQLILIMYDTDDEGICRPQPTINLKWSGIVIDENVPKQIKQAASKDIELYETCEPDIPTHEPARLQLDIITKMLEMLNDGPTRTELVNSVISKVSFSSQLEFREGELVGGELVNNKIFLPVSATVLSASLESKMFAKIHFRPESADSTIESSIEMVRTNQVELPSDCRPDCTPLSMEVIKVNGGDVDVPKRFEIWPPDLMGMLTRHTDTKVFMTTYVKEDLEPFVSVDNGIILDIGDDDE